MRIDIAIRNSVSKWNCSAQPKNEAALSQAEQGWWFAQKQLRAASVNWLGAICFVSMKYSSRIVQTHNTVLVIDTCMKS